jgi:hypothetical protein
MEDSYVFARALNSCTAGNVLSPTVFSDGLVPQDFRGYHSLLIVHAWMFHKKLLMAGTHGNNVEEALYDELWEDTHHRIRMLGIHELSVSSHSNI